MPLPCHCPLSGASVHTQCDDLDHLERHASWRRLTTDSQRRLLAAQVRKPAEDALRAAQKSAEIVGPLLQQVCENPEPPIRQLAAILLRKCVTALWVQLPDDSKAAVKRQLLERLGTGAHSHVNPHLPAVHSLVVYD